MAGYTKLFSDLIASSIWNESNETRIVWITLLAMADAEGYVHVAIPSLAVLARVNNDACQTAISVLEAPDPNSRTTTDDGRRIKRIDGGFFIINYEKHRNRLSNDERSAYMREYMRKYRGKHQKEEKANNVNLTLANPASASAYASDLNSSSEGSLRGEKPHELSDFDIFWKLYPRKVGKGKAREVFNRKKCSQYMATIELAIQDQLKSDQWIRENGQFIPHPSTWLNQERWLDEPLKPTQRQSLFSNQTDKETT